MKRALTLLVAALCLGANAYPAQAGDYGKKTASTDSSEFLRETAMLPVKVMAVGTALAIGTPIAVLRCEGNKLGQYTEALSDEATKSGGSAVLMLASLPGQTLNLLAGVGEGLVAGSTNAVEGWHDPFSDKSFSLDELNSEK
ncbi:MAG: hypothetical protein IPK73_24725 [Candidatus Obscuribacter sp.]|nr:hypothetical protein [Candidatus Obscuribacter sp.]